MTRSQMVLWSLLAVLLAFAPAGSAWATSGTQVPDPGVLLQENPKAKGAIIHGQLSIFYTTSSTPNLLCAGINSPIVDMHIALQGWQRRISNSTTAGQIVRGQCYFGINVQRDIIKNLIQNQLLPKFKEGKYTTFELKNADNLFQDEGNGGTDESPWFLMMDFTLAAQ